MATKDLPWNIRIHENSVIYKKQFTSIRSSKIATKMGDRCSLNYDIIHNIYIKLINSAHWQWFSIKVLYQITLWEHTESNATPWTDTLVYDRMMGLTVFN